MKNLKNIELIRMLSSILDHIWTPNAIKHDTCFEHFFETLSGEAFESIGPPFRELLATILETFWEQREKVKHVLSCESEPS